MTLAEGLKRFRKQFKLTQKEIAAATNTAETLYQRYEYGKVIPSATFLIDLANFFKVSIDYLAGLSDNPKINR